VDSFNPRAVRELAGRIRALLFVRYSLGLVTLWAFGWGVAVLVLRAWLSVDRVALLWGGSGVAAALVVALVVARRRTPDARRLRAAIDRHSRAGGLVMAGEQAELGAWAKMLPTGAPRVRLAARRPLVLLVSALAFVGAAFALPDQLTALGRPGTPLDVREQVEQLADQIETLEQEQVIEPTAAEAMKDKLDQIAREASGDDPAATWQRLDYIKQELSGAADEAAEQALRETQTLSELIAEAEALDKALDASDAATPGERRELAERMKEVGELAAKAMAESRALGELSDAAWKDAAERLAELDDAALDALAKLDQQAAAALAKLGKKLEEIEAGSLAYVDAGGAMAVFKPDATTTLTEIGGKAKLPVSHAVRMTSKAVFEYDPTIIMTVDLSAMGIGERIIALDDQDQKLAIYQRDPTATATRDKLEHGGKEVVFTVSPSDRVERFEYDRPQTQACRACQGAGKTFRMMQADAAAAQGELEQMIEAMAQQGLVDAEQMAEAMQAARAGQPGRGGVNRGRADAPMTWKDPSNDEQVEFEEQSLPPATVDALERSRQLGVSRGAPELAADGTVVEAGALGRSAADGGSAARHPVLPRHRAAVERYFQDD
jgi:hypothetical protein